MAVKFDSLPEFTEEHKTRLVLSILKVSNSVDAPPNTVLDSHPEAVIAKLVDLGMTQDEADTLVFILTHTEEETAEALFVYYE